MERRNHTETAAVGVRGVRLRRPFPRADNAVIDYAIAHDDCHPMPRRFQFSLRDLFWLVLVVASLLGGMAIQKQRDKPLPVLRAITTRTSKEAGTEVGWTERIRLPDGTEWDRFTPDDDIVARFGGRMRPGAPVTTK